MVFWPCLLKLNGDDELTFLGSQQALLSECNELIFSDDDYVIDSDGISYIIKISSDKLTLEKKQTTFNVEQITDLIRLHEFNKAEVCLTKIYFETIFQAIESLSHSLKREDNSGQLFLSSTQ